MHGLFEMLEHRLSLGFVHLCQTDNNRLAGLQQKLEKLRGHLVVITLVRSGANQNVGERGDLHEPGDISSRGPGRHIRAIPDHGVSKHLSYDRT